MAGAYTTFNASTVPQTTINNFDLEKETKVYNGIGVEKLVQEWGSTFRAMKPGQKAQIGNMTMVIPNKGEDKPAGTFYKKEAAAIARHWCERQAGKNLVTPKNAMAEAAGFNYASHKRMYWIYGVGMENFFNLYPDEVVALYKWQEKNYNAIKLALDDPADLYKSVVGKSTKGITFQAYIESAENEDAIRGKIALIRNVTPAGGGARKIRATYIHGAMKKFDF
jgi:hypothetical protein